MRIFITGATGFVGRNFLEYALAERPEAEITCLVRDKAKAEAQWPQGTPDRLRWLEGDLLEPATYDAAVNEADYVFHIAALVSLRDGPEFYAANTEATRNLLESLAGGSSLKRLVFTGSISSIDRPKGRVATGPLTEETTPSPNTDYGKSKLEAEKLIMTSGLPYSILRPAYIYGPHPRLKSSMDRLIHDVLDARPYTQLPLPGRASHIYVEDLAEMIWVASQHPAAANEIFFVGDREPAVIGDVFPLLAGELGVDYRRREVSPRWMERFRKFLYARQPENLMARILFEDTFYCSCEKWFALTGHQPRYGLRDGMARTVRWYREHGLL